jgi:N,N'-diacetylchitobiose transport system substrate-binding protein
MKARQVAAVSVAAAVAVCGFAGCGSSDNGKPSGSTNAADQGSATGTMTVWLMDGSAPNDLVKNLDSQFTSAHTGVKINYQVQEWDSIQDKLTTALASNTPPDVIELGNTQTAQYAASGGLENLSSKAASLGASGWLSALKKSGQWQGKQYGIPFYAGNRVVIYRKDLFKKAGIKSPPTSVAEWIADGKKLAADNKDNPHFVPLYLPGQEWYTLASFIWDHDGDLAVKKGGTWKGAVDTRQAEAGIKEYKTLFDALSKRSIADTDEATPQQYTVMAKGTVGMMVGLPWELNSAVTKKGGGNPALDGKLGAFPIPSYKAGKTAPVFLGGSNLAIPAGSQHKKLAYEWVKQMTGQQWQTKLAKENSAVPNSSSYAGAVSSDPVLSVEVKAAGNASRVTPITPTWAAVEAAPNPLKDMLTQVLTGKASVAQAAKKASARITSKMASSS